jgi:hypothetical protein
VRRDSLLLLLGVCRLAVAIYSGLENNRGDFYATLPGAYAQTLNPDLWNSPDLRNADGYQRAEYLYGPTQYLTILPLVIFDSYQSLATLLLFVYAGLIALSAVLMWRSFRLFSLAPASGFAAVFASTCLFLPLLQAYGQREFEVVVLFLTTAALYALVTRREVISGALLGYAAWFKFFPLAFLPYFALRGRRRAAAAFVLMSVLVLGITEVFLNLSRFTHVVELAAVQGRASVLDDSFCEAWSQPETRHHALANNTRASIKWALCSFQDRWPWLSARAVYASCVVLMVTAFAVGFVRLRRQPALDAADERWRTSLEVGLLLTSRWLVYAHYYYLAFAIVPLNALLVRYLGEIAAGRRCRRLWVWGMTYLCLSAFVIPPSVLTQILGIDYWRFYMRSGAYVCGEVLLIGLILWEYIALSGRRATGPVSQDDAPGRSGVVWRPELQPAYGSRASIATAMKMNISGWTVMLYRMFVSTKQMVSGTYTTGTRNSISADPDRHAIPTPTRNSPT